MQGLVRGGERGIARADVLDGRRARCGAGNRRRTIPDRARAASRTVSYHCVLLIAASCSASEPGRRRRSNSASSAGTSRARDARLEQRDRILHREPRARADGRMAGAQRVAEQHDVAPVPAPVADDRVAEPLGPVRQQRLAVEIVAEHVARNRRGSALPTSGRAPPRARSADRIRRGTCCACGCSDRRARSAGRRRSRER